MGLLAEARAKTESGGLLAQAKKRLGIPVPNKYAGTLGDLSRLGGPSFATKTSTQAIPDENTLNTGEVIKQVALGTGRFARDVGQSVARGYGAVGQGIVSAATGGKAPIAYNPTTKFEQALFGTDKPFSLQDVGEEYPGVPKGASFAPFIGGLGVALDLVGGGGLKGLKGLTTALKDAKTAEQAARLMKGAGFTDDIIKDYSTLFAKTTDAAQIEKGLLAAEKLQNTTVAKGATGTKIVDEPMTAETRSSTPVVRNEIKIVSDTPREPFKLDFDTIRRGEEMAVASKRPTITDPEELVRFIDREGDGNVGVFLKPEEKQLLGDFLNSIDNLELKGAIVGREKRASNEGRDLVLGKVNDRFIVVGEKGAGAGKVRIHRTPMGISGDKVLGKVDIQNFLDTTATPIRSATAPVGQGPEVARVPQTTQPLQAPQQGVPPATTQGLSSPELNHISTENARGFQQAAEVGAKTTKEPNLYRRVTSKLGKAFNTTLEIVQDKERMVRKLMENKTMKVSDATNVYQKMTLYTGRTARKVELAHARMEKVANDIVNIAHDAGRDVAEVRADVNKYLHAVHAPERNVALGDGAAGMTTAQAVKELERINSLPNAADIKRAAEEMRKLNAEGFALLKEAGVISDEYFTELTIKYKNHVPLNRILDGEEIQSALSIRGFDVRSTGIKKAKGSDKEVADILANIQHNYEQAVLRSEKNIVDQSTLAFVRDNKEALGDSMVIKKPHAIGRDFDGRLMMETTTNPQYLQMYENGKHIWIYIKDPDLAAAVRGVGSDKLPKVLHAVGAFTRLMAGLATRFNPEFAFPNKLRDLQETMVYAAAQKDIGFRGAAKFAAKDPASIKAVAEFYFGRDTAGTRLYKEMQELGGTTGGLGLSTRKQVELDIDKMIATAGSRPRQMFSDVVTYIDNWNAIMEDSTRLSMYKQALEQGASKERAAFLAKEASINFNRMGRGGPVINSLYMFSNASVQGSAKMIRSLRNPKVAATVITTVGASVATVNQWNDTVDPQWRDKVTKWDRLNSLPFMIPNANGEGATYIAIPVSWGIKPIKVMADFAYDAASGVNVDAAQVTGDLFTSVIEAYNPLGGTDFTSTLVPTIADMPVELARNQSWSGSKIKPDYDQNAPADVQYFKTLGETVSGKFFIQGTKNLQEMTGIAISPADVKYVFENLIGGAGRFAVKNANTIVGAATGEPVPLDEFPFVSRFYRERDEEETGQGAAGEVQEVNKLLQTQSRERFYVKKEAEQLYEQWNNIPKEEARANWNALNKEKPDLAKKITEIARQEAKGLTYFERQITELGVENGERAKYLFGKFNELKTSEEKKALWELYSDKKIITEDVAKQLKYLIAHPEVIKQSNAGTGTSASKILGALTGARTAQAAEEVAPGTLKAQPQTIGEFFRGETRLERTPTEPAMGQKLDPEAIRRGITGVENSGNANSYEVVGVTGDLGRYQASPTTVSSWSKSWLGKKYTKQEFLADPDAQEEFFNQYLAVAQRYNLTPEETAVAWHAGWGELGTGPRETREARFRAKLAEQMKTPENQRYVKKFSTFINS